MHPKQPCRRVLITGGAGFIGSHLADLLLQEGHFVTAVDNLCNGQIENLKNGEGNPRFNFIQADIRNPADLKGIFSQVDWVFHLAALNSIVPSIEKPRDYFETNVDGTYNVLEASRCARVKRFIYTASSSCYGPAPHYPTPETAPIHLQSPYALTKYLGEQLVLHWAEVYKLPALSLRLFNVYGPRISTTNLYSAVFGVFLTQKLHGKPLTIVGDGNQMRDFTFVTDVAEAFYAAAKSDLTNDVMNVGSACCYSINQIAELLGGPVTYIPKRPGESEYSCADIDKIYKKLSWKARVPFEEGLQKIEEFWYAAMS